MEFVQIKRRVRVKSSSFWWYKCISVFDLILENIRKMFLLYIRAAGKMYMKFGEIYSPNMLENQTRLQNSAYTTRKSLIFHVLCALFEQIPSGINQDILKHPTWCGAKHS